MGSSSRDTTPSPFRHSASSVPPTRPDPLVWAEALKQAGGDARRLTLLDDGTVLVLRNADR